MITKAIQAIFKVNLGVKRDEKVLVFTDRISPSEVLQENDLCRRERLRDIALLVSEIGRSFTKKIIYYEYIATGSHGAEPPKELWEIAFGRKTVDELNKRGLLSKILRKEATAQDLIETKNIIKKNVRYAVNAVIALSNYSTSHTRFRDFLTTICGCRYASMPLFDTSMLEGSMNVNWKGLSKRTRSIANILKKAEEIEIKTPNGTHITMTKGNRKVFSDDGILTRPGSFGNLPAGEVFFAPIEGTAEGRLVLEWAPMRVLKSPITLIVKKGHVEDISGDESYIDFLKNKLSERPENRNIAELGIGTNDRAKRPDNILESEKILGTIHIALGDNSSFGGTVQTPFHQDFVFFRPTILLKIGDGEKIYLLKDGRFIDNVKSCIKKQS
jgi:leucyl aminopeptidase (aminopeptidase T)